MSENLPREHYSQENQTGRDINPDRINPYIPEGEDYAKVTRLIKSLQEEAQEPMGNDVYLAALCRATIPELMRGGRLRPHIEEIFAFRRRSGSYFPDVYAMRMLNRAVQKQAIKSLPDDFFPFYFDNDYAWSKYVYADTIDYLELSEDMSLRNIQSNIPERYKSFHLIAHLYKDRIGASPTVLDVGDSLNLGLKKWNNLSRFPFNHTEVISPIHLDNLISEEHEIDDENTLKVNHLLNLPPKIQKGVGFDILPVRIDDNDTLLWVEACSFRPTELVDDRQRLIEFFELTTHKSPNISSFPQSVDVRDRDSIEQLVTELPNGKADLITCSTVFYQLTSKQIQESIQNLKELCSDNGLIVINDFVRIDPSLPNRMRFYPQNRWIYPYSFRTLVIDPSKQETKPQEVFRFKSGRADHIWLTKFGRKLLEKI